MKTIKFRQPLKGGGFHYWGYVNDAFIGPVGENYTTGTSEQFTGLKDKNGVEIYEGDIYINPNHPKSFYTVFFSRGCFLGGKNENSCAPLAWDEDGDYGTSWLEVVGNIHEKPELLEAQENEQ